MATTITATDVISEFGSYYINEGQNTSRLLLRPFQAFGSREVATNVPTEDTQIRYSDVTVSEILQPYQDAFTAKGSVTFEPVTIDLQQVKVDQAFNPNNLVYSWLGFLTSTNTDRTTWPFVRWFIEVYLMNQLFDDLEVKAFYDGVKATPTPGTAGTAAGIINGIKKLINDRIAAGKITPIAIGAWSTTPATFVGQVEAFAAAIPQKYWDKKLVFNFNKQLELRFKQGMRTKYNSYYSQESDLLQLADFPNFSVKGRVSMGTSEKVWTTPIENLVWATKGFANANGFELEKIDRTVKIYTDFHIGMDFLLNDLLFTNDLELPA